MKWFLAFSAIVLLVFFTFAIEIVDHVQLALEHWGWRSPPGAAITVQIPAVHTRERLMNDRFEQVAWLKEQLDKTLHLTPPDLMSGDLAKSSHSQVGATNGKTEATSPSADPDSKSDQKPRISGGKSFTDETKALPNPVGWFERLNSYRDVIREQQALAMLDDRHDMDSNELYFLSFDATILAGATSNGFATIEVVLAPNIGSLGPWSWLKDKPGAKYAAHQVERLQKQDMVDIYFDWLGRAQKLVDFRVKINQSFAKQNNQWTFTPGYEQPQATLETLICVEWTKRRSNLEGRLRTHSDVPNFKSDLMRWIRESCSPKFKPPHTPDEQVELARKLDTEKTTIADRHKSLINLEFLTDVQVIASDVGRVLTDFERSIDYLHRQVYDQKMPELAVAEGLAAAVVPSYDDAVAQCITNLNGPAHRDLNGSQVLRSDDPPNTMFRISDKPFPCPQWRKQVDILVVLSALLRQLMTDDPIPIGFDNAGAMLKLIKIEEERPSMPNGRPGQPSPFNYETGTVIESSEGVIATRITNRADALQCLAALAEYDRINSEAGQVIPGRGERMDAYFSLRVEAHDDGTCSLILDPKIHAGDWRPQPIDPGQAVVTVPTPLEEQILQLMRARLESLAGNAAGVASASNTEVFAFSYGTSPRLRRDYMLHSTAASSLTGNWLGSKLGLSAAGSFTGELSDAAVVGYVPPAPVTGETAGPAARFGWVISPERDGASSWQRHLSMQQAELGALVAVPSWWRTVYLRTCTGLVSESKLAGLAKSWQDPNKAPLQNCRVDILRLPGTGQDVSRRLGVEVLTFPYLTPPDDLQDADEPQLAVGQPATLLLEGGRLWRSTVVLLGAQRADRIEVLPDMQGLTAYFKCVEIPTISKPPLPPWDKPQWQSVKDGYVRTVEVPVRVWTSEGVTARDGAFARVAVPTIPPAKDICPENRADYHYPPTLDAPPTSASK